MNTVIVDTVRTGSGKGKPGGSLSHLHPAALLGDVIAALVEITGVDPERIDDVYAGCVSQFGMQTQNIARTAALAAGLPVSVPGTTIDRQCGSSQQALQFAHAAIAAGHADAIIVCGVEMMSTHPIGAAAGDRDPIAQSVHERFGGLVHQGIGAELIAARYGISREHSDEFAARSHRLAHEYAKFHNDDILAVSTPTGLHDRDETVRASTIVEKLAGLSPVFVDNAVQQRFPEISWQITAGNSSPLTDGASALLVTSERFAAEFDLEPRARVVSSVAVGSDPIEMLTGVIPATEKLLARTGMTLDQIDAYEVNEAFAPVPLAWLDAVGADPDRLNIAGGAIALGHPLGATGAKLAGTLVHALEHTEGRYGLQTMCEGGGMANATLIERI
ncbi:thiolase family protein [Agrococcus casei]|uniref:thiolase family protein n=1 Tax=Agrococcus casei TaxID=343512 RepID=UPI003F91D464